MAEKAPPNQGTSTGMIQRGISLEDNLARQISEIEVLKSILSDDMLVIRENQELKISVSIEAPGDGNIKVATPMSVREEVKVAPKEQSRPLFQRQISAGGKPCYPITVKHIPPLDLYVAYHDRYPSETPPYFDINARWLDRKVASQIKQDLIRLFTPGCEFVFELVEYLKTDFLGSYLKDQAENYEIEGDVSDTLKEPNIMFIRSSSVVADVEEYDQYRKHQIFLDESHFCFICAEEKKGSFFPEVTLPCNHLFCSSCLAEYAQVKLGSGGVNRLKCPALGCDSDLSAVLLRSVLADQHFERYERLLEEFILDSLPGTVYCPRPCCRQRVLSDPNDSLAVCETCHYPFCKCCNQLWHGPQGCDTEIQPVEQSLSDKVKEAQSKQGIPETKRKELVADLQAAIWFASNNNVKKCPNCSYVIIKSGGCNKMICTRCGRNFCWICNKPISGYDHFSDKGCVLFRNEDFNPPTEPKDVDVTFDTDEDFDLFLHPKCPKCLMENLKDYTRDDNMMICKLCSFKYCFQCLEACFGPWHFGEYDFSCKRFTKLQEDREFVKRKK